MTPEEGEELMIQNEKFLNQPVQVLTHTTRIVMLAMAMALICVATVSVTVVLIASNIQHNADTQERQNQELQEELRCLREPTFQADKADAELAIITARGLAAVAESDITTLEALSEALTIGADVLENKMELRGDSLDRCTTGP